MNKTFFRFFAVLMAAVMLVLIAGCMSASSEKPEKNEPKDEPAVLDQTPKPTSNPSPISADEIPEAPPEDRSLLPGEVLLSGNADFSQADSFTVSFIMSEDRREIRDIQVVIENLSLSATSGSTKINMNSGSASMTYMGTHEVKDGVIDAPFGDGSLLSLVINDNIAEGTIDYIYVLSTASALSGPSERIPVDMGSQPIKFVSDVSLEAVSDVEQVSAGNDELKAEAIAYLEALSCPIMSEDENRLGFKIVSIAKADGDYKIRWDSNLSGNDAFMFSLMRFFDPDDFSNNYQPFTISDGEIHYDYKEGDELTYREFRVSGFEPESKILFMYFGGATESMGAPSEIQTDPLFFTFVLGEQPELVESKPRLANGVFDGYLE